VFSDGTGRDDGAGLTTPSDGAEICQFPVEVIPDLVTIDEFGVHRWTQVGERATTSRSDKTVVAAMVRPDFVGGNSPGHEAHTPAVHVEEGELDSVPVVDAGVGVTPRPSVSVPGLA
jgi:hypothetical protein